MPTFFLHAVILSILLFFTACNTSPSGQHAAQQDETPAAKACITQVIALDDSLGSVRNHACKQISLSQTIQQYVQGLEKANFEGCPPAFTTAYEQHLEAWTQMIPVTDHYPELRGEMHDLFDIIEQGEHQDDFKLRLAAIWETWGAVEGAMGE